MKEEDDVRERHENDFFGERVLQRLDRAVDQFAAIVEGLDRHARRQTRRDLRNLLFHALDHVMRVFAGAHDDDAADDFAAIDIERAAPEIAADLDPRDIAQVNRRAFALEQDDLFQVAPRS